MADHIYIKCLGETFGARSPYKVYSEDDWMSVMWNDKMHDLNIWWDENKDQWQWAVYPLKVGPRDGSRRQGPWRGDMLTTDTSVIVAEGNAEVAEDYEGH